MRPYSEEPNIPYTDCCSSKPRDLLHSDIFEKTNSIVFHNVRATKNRMMGKRVLVCFDIGILKRNREKEEDLVATGILPVTLNRQAGSLSYHSAPAPILSVTGTKLLRTAIIEDKPEQPPASPTLLTGSQHFASEICRGPADSFQLLIGHSYIEV